MTTPTGCLTGLAVIFTQGLVGGSYPCGCKKMLKWLSALILILIFGLIFEKLKINESPALILTCQKLSWITGCNGVHYSFLEGSGIVVLMSRRFQDCTFAKLC